MTGNGDVGAALAVLVVDFLLATGGREAKGLAMGGAQ